MLREKALECLYTKFFQMDEWFRKHAGLSYKTMSKKSESVTEEKVGARKPAEFLPLHSEHH
jgi:hypothetical protein